jgi:hypothetical protein
MNFFNIDLHISVIEDIKTIFADLGHTVDSLCLSDHNWVFNRPRAVLKPPYDKLRMVHSMDEFFNQSFCDAFYEDTKDILSVYDGFIACYPPLFSLLYQKFEKPIYTVAATRYDHPLKVDSNVAWFNEKLFEMWKSGQLIPIANNRYDAYYCKSRTNIDFKYIPSLCSYTNALYTGTKDPIVAGRENIPPYKHITSIPAHSWYELYSHKAIIHIPYNVSLMSIFEQYTAGVPLLFPYFNARERFNTFLNEAGGQEAIDMRYLSDFYDEEWMPHLKYFDSIEDLHAKINEMDFFSISSNMKEFNKIRKQRIYDLWEEVI